MEDDFAGLFLRVVIAGVLYGIVLTYVQDCIDGPKDREWHQCVSTCGSQATWDTRDGFCLCEGQWEVVE